RAESRRSLRRLRAAADAVHALEAEGGGAARAGLCAEEWVSTLRAQHRDAGDVVAWCREARRRQLLLRQDRASTPARRLSTAMPRPRFHKLSGDQQQAILGAALEEFASHGFNEASLNRIIDAAGISKGSMYYYFDGKEDLFAHVARA